MPTAEGMLFLLFLTGQQWTRNNAGNLITFRSNTNNTNISPTAFTVASSRTPVASGRTPVSESNIPSTNLTPTLTHHSLTSYQPSLTTENVNHSWASNNNTSLSVLPTTTSGGDETYIKSSTTESISFTTITHNVNFTTTVFHNTTQMNGITFQPTKNLSNVTTTVLTTKSISGTTELWTTAPITNLPPTSHGSKEAREHQKVNPTKGAVVFGAIVGTVLGSMLISLAGYFICGKRKSEQFGHQRLYDDTRNDPVLRLDIIPEPYTENVGDLSYYKPITSNENAAQKSKETSYDAIPMDAITSSQLSSEMYKN